MLSVLMLVCRGQSDPAFSTGIKVQIVDEGGSPVANAEILVAYPHLFDAKLDRDHNGKTDAKGVFLAEDKVNRSILVRASKEGYYPIFVEDVVTRVDVETKKIKNLDLPLVMRRVKSPVSLYAKKVSLPIPMQDQLIGFDFEVGDWIEPFGAGINSDFLMLFNNKINGYEDGYTYEQLLSEIKSAHATNPSSKEAYFKEIKRFYGNNKEYSYEDAIKKISGKWTGSVIIKFPCNKEGIALVDKDFCSYSRLSMPHLAYDAEYESTWRWEASTFSPKTTREKIGYFIRTRVKLDEKGEIVSANYAKLTSDLQFDPRGRVEFTYVFNPTPNDRNLEFDPHANRFKSLDDDERVVFP